MKNKFAIILLAILAVSALSFTASAYAMPFMSWKTLPNSASPKVSIQQSFVRMDGNTTEWGSTPVLGTVEAQSRTIVNGANAHQGFSSTAIWTTNTTEPIAAVRALENFTYVFYSARLVAGNYSALYFGGNGFFMNGTWNVWSVTINFTVITDSSGNILSVNNNLTAVPLATKAYGELNVTSDWSNFTLAITGIDPLTGTVIAYRISSGTFSPFIIGTGTSTTVTTTDLSDIAKAYGSMPGSGNYDPRMDYCLNYKIDICDLSTAAANLNSAQ